MAALPPLPKVVAEVPAPLNPTRAIKGHCGIKSSLLQLAIFKALGMSDTNLNLRASDAAAASSGEAVCREAAAAGTKEATWMCSKSWGGLIW